MANQIRSACIADHKVMDRIFRTSAKALCSEAYGAEVIDAWVANPRPDRYQGDHYYLLECQGKVIGFGGLNKDENLLEALFISPDMAGRGAGREMLQFLVTKAKILGTETLKVESSLNAVDFYKKNGFAELLKSELQIGNVVSLDSVIMEQTLSD